MESGFSRNFILPNDLNNQSGFIFNLCMDMDLGSKIVQNDYFQSLNLTPVVELGLFQARNPSPPSRFE